MKKILVIPNSIDNLDKVLKTSVDGIILPIKGLSVNSSVYFNIEDIKELLLFRSMEIEDLLLENSIYI